MNEKRNVTRIVLATALVLGATPRFADADEARRWSAGYRFELLTADGWPANDIMGSGAFLRYAISDAYRVEGSLSYFEYDFEDLQRRLGFSGASVEEGDSRTRLTVVSMRIDRSWKCPIRDLRPLAFAGLGMGYAVVDDRLGTAGGRRYDIDAEGGIEAVPVCGLGVQYGRNGWSVDAGIKLERHVADWDMQDRLSAARCEVGDYTAWGGWAGLSLVL